MKIRQGTKQDMPDVLRLITELAVFEREPEAVVVTVDDLIRDGFGSEPLFHTFIAENEGEIVGMALFYYRYSTWKGKTIHLEDLIVTETARGTGVGLALYSKIIEQGKKRQRETNRMERARLERTRGKILREIGCESFARLARRTHGRIGNR